MSPETVRDEGLEEAASTAGTRLQPLVDIARRIGAWAAANRLKAGLVGGACLVSMVGVVTVWLVLAPDSEDENVTLEMAMEALDNGAYSEARELAAKLRKSGEVPGEAMGGPAFVAGAAVSYEADESWNVDKEDFYLLSARYLEEARDLGFPPMREGEGLFLLGRNLYLSGQIPASRPVLHEALKLNPQKKSEIHGLLTEAYLNDADPKYPEALEQNTRYLADRVLRPDKRYKGLLQRAQILLRMGKLSECLSTLEEIPPDGKHRADALVIRGHVQLLEARILRENADAEGVDNADVLQKYQTALKTLRTAQSRDTLSTQASHKAMYLAGLCFLEMGNYREALKEFVRTRRMHADTPEALAADFEVAELSRKVGQDEEALEAYRRTLAAVGDVTNYSNPWITLEGLRNRSMEAYRHYLKIQKFDLALQLVQLFDPLFTATRARQLTAETYHSWGRHLLDQAEQVLPREAEPYRREGREKLRLAGNAYGELARFRAVTEYYPEDLWASAEDYMEGHDYRGAVETLQLYLKNASRRRYPRALIYLGEALLNLGEFDKALSALKECIEFYPRDAAAYRARLMASTAHAEQGEVTQAEALLEENLNGILRPDSNEWRDSLFALGRLLHQERRYEEAIGRLEEACTRYPDSEGVTEARYLIAECYRKSAQAAREKLEGNLVESVRAENSKKIRGDLNSALVQYKEAQRILNERQEVTELTELERKTLRNCYFAIGATLFDLRRYEDAIEAYTAATSRYQNDPESLEGYVQIARAQRRLNNTEQAQGTLKRAVEILKRMKTKTNFDDATNYSAEEWAELLLWLETL